MKLNNKQKNTAVAQLCTVNNQKVYTIRGQQFIIKQQKFLPLEGSNSL